MAAVFGFVSSFCPGVAFVHVTSIRQEGVPVYLWWAQLYCQPLYTCTSRPRIGFPRFILWRARLHLQNIQGSHRVSFLQLLFLVILCFFAFTEFLYRAVFHRWDLFSELTIIVEGVLDSNMPIHSSLKSDVYNTVWFGTTRSEYRVVICSLLFKTCLW